VVPVAAQLLAALIPMLFAMSMLLAGINADLPLILKDFFQIGKFPNFGPAKPLGLFGIFHNIHYANR
jgi:hypothetical protein